MDKEYNFSRSFDRMDDCRMMAWVKLKVKVEKYLTADNDIILFFLTHLSKRKTKETQTRSPTQTWEQEKNTLNCFSTNDIPRNTIKCLKSIVQ